MRAKVTLRQPAFSGRRVRHLGRPHPRRRVRQERQRQPVRRRLCHSARLVPKGVGRAVRVLEARREPARARPAALGDSRADDGGRAHGRPAAGDDSTTAPRWRCRRGSLGTDDVQRLGRPLAAPRVAAGRTPPCVSGEYNYASGDADPTDGTRGTFDQLYPTPHDKYGLADQVGWRNIHHVRAGVELTPVQGTAGHGQLPLVVAGREARRRSMPPAARRSPALPAARRPPRRTGARRRRSARALTPQLQLAGATPTSSRAPS